MEYNAFTIYVIFGSVVGLLFILISYLLSPKLENRDMEKISPFECGFISFNQTRNVFTVVFYLVGLLFIVFDLELLELYPFLLSGHYSKLYSNVVVLLFLVYLTVGFSYELSKNALKV